MLAKIMNNEKGVTRLVVATMLIACLALAGLVAWVTFSPEEEGQPFYAGLTGEESLELRSAVLACGDGTGIDKVTFTVAIPEGADPVNFTGPPDNVVVISYDDGRPLVDDLFWTCTKCIPGDYDNILEAGEMFEIEVYTPDPGAGTSFKILVGTPDGKVFDIKRTTPDDLTPVMNLK